jgi:hypothetical protein
MQMNLALPYSDLLTLLVAYLLFYLPVAPLIHKSFRLYQVLNAELKGGTGFLNLKST